MAFGISAGPYNGAVFTVSPSDFTISPGQQENVVLTITPSDNALTELFSPEVVAHANSADVLETQMGVPQILVSNFTPACLSLLSSQEPSPPLTFNASSGGTGFGPVPSTPDLSAVPTINLEPQRNATVLYTCLNVDNLSFNVTAPAGLSAEVDPNPMNIAVSNSAQDKMYSLTIVAQPGLSSGIHEVKVSGVLNGHIFNTSFYVAVA